jgi:hypothetical protein
MKTILVVCVPTRDAGLAAKKASAGLNLDGFQSSVSPANRAVNGRIESSKREQPTPPFWTWFIENPRVGGAA